VVVLFIAWSVGRLVGAALVRNPARRRAGRRIFGCLFLVGAGVAISTRSFSPPVEAENMWRVLAPNVVPIIFSTGMTIGDVETLSERAAGEAELARVLLLNAGSAEATDVLLIGTSTDHPMVHSEFVTRWPRDSIFVSEVRPVDSSPRAPEIRRISTKHGSLTLVFADADVPAAR
jgi:hypothetical protein